MKYYIIAGEASGDLHASRLMRSLRVLDPQAEFRFFGGDKMQTEGGEMVRHYRDTAFMGFLPVITHLRTIFRNLSLCKRDIVRWQPDAVIPVDYAGFNLNVCSFLTSYRKRHATSLPHTFYYISPKIWAWKEWRVKNFKRDVEEMLCILPFEKTFFEDRHHYPVHYVGNPTAEEVRTFQSGYDIPFADFCVRNGLDPSKPVVALLAGSRRHEISDNLPAMLEAAGHFSGCQFVVACAPSIDLPLYEKYLAGTSVRYVENQTYALLHHATAAIVTSGTATLETALFGVPQVVCYKTILPRIYRWAFNHVIKCRYISLVNLIADKPVVEELFADTFSVSNIVSALNDILPGGRRREEMLGNYAAVHQRIGSTSAPDEAARIIVEKLRQQK